ncbi:MAG: DNA transposition protein [Rhodospirillum sp.]|nr:DNA transposition protein [Rhodospirillum sp.]MCF8491393.1 DNA transposition protein [Rhodospirillum sp.]
MPPRDRHTLDLFRDWTPPEVAVRVGRERLHPDIEARISQAISETLKDCGKGRGSVAEEMGAYLGQPVTANVLNNYASPGQDGHRISLSRAFALIAATGDPRVLALELEPLGFAIIPDRFLGAVEEAQCAEQLEAITARQKLARKKWRGGR